MRIQSRRNLSYLLSSTSRIPNLSFRTMSLSTSSVTSESDSSKEQKISSKLVSSPQSSWIPGQKQPHPFEKAVHVPLNPKELASSYFLLISGIVPRPIAFVSTISSNGIQNLSPFSYFGAVAHDPPTVCVGITKNRNGSDKDTFNNIKETNEFVVNIISEWFVEAANHCSGAFPPEVDEIAVSGLTPIPSTMVQPSRIAESAFQMECQLVSVTEIKNDKGEITSHVVLGKVVMFHVLEPLLKQSVKGYEVDLDGYKPIGRLGGDRYVKLGDYFDILRPKV